MTRRVTGNDGACPYRPFVDYELCRRQFSAKALTEDSSSATKQRNLRIHVDRDDCSAKFWLEPVRLASNMGYNAKELRAIESIVTEKATLCKEAWNGFFNA